MARYEFRAYLSIEADSEANLTAHCSALRTRLEARHSNAAFVGLQDGGDQFQQRSFSAAVRTHNGQHFTGADFKRHAAQRVCHPRAL